MLIHTQTNIRKAKYTHLQTAQYKSSKVKARLAKANAARLNKENCRPTAQAVCSSLSGCRIVNMDQLRDSIDMLTAHSAECGGKCTLEGETMHSGLALIMQASCIKCGLVFSMKTSPRAQTSNGKQWTVNLGAVLGELSTGGGLTKLNSSLALMNVPGMQKQMYSKMEEFFGKEMRAHLASSMLQVAEEEKQHAVEANSYHQGIPSITVVVDGGWSKRSHKHSYNAKSGVAVIFGSHTKKLLFIGVRNKFCAVCAVAANKCIDAPQHTCYRNWSGSSAAMESDIIAEGFNLSEKMYGIRYMSVIGDGDSSVMATIRQRVPYGIFVKKIECANHACKAYRSRLEELAKDNPRYRGKGGLTKKAIQRLTVGARIAIVKHSATKNISQLRHDLRNGPSHVFGDHARCNGEFCTFRQSQSTPDPKDSQDEDILPNSKVSSFEHHIDNIILAEADKISVRDEREATHGGHPSVASNLAPGLPNAVAKCADRIVSLAPQLISNQTSNLAENYMSIRCVMDGGKQVNRIQRGSFEHRCSAAGLATQHGASWTTSLWKAATKREAGLVHRTHTSAKLAKCSHDKQRKQTREYKIQRRSTRTKSTASTDHHYGPDSQQDDVPPTELLQLCQEFHRREVEVSQSQRDYIEQHTLRQSEDSLWHHQRRLRLTASNFGKVVKRRSTTAVGNLVKSLLYSKGLSTEATRWGINHEDEAKRQYLEHLCMNGHPDTCIKDSGLVVDPQSPSLACSPDGLVDIIGGEGGIVEIKCPYNAAKEGLDPVSAAKTMKTFFCKVSVLDSDNVELKRGHDYFYQVQGTMAITRRSWCDFVVWTPKGMSVERIAFDAELWVESKTTLQAFYQRAILPELALPRLTRGQPIRELTSGYDITAN